MEDITSSKAERPPPAIIVPGTIIMATKAEAMPIESAQPAKLPLIPENTSEPEPLPLPVSAGVSEDVSLPEDALLPIPPSIHDASDGTSSSTPGTPGPSSSSDSDGHFSFEPTTEKAQCATLRSPLRMVVARQNNRRKMREVERVARRREKRAEEAQQQVAAQQIICLQVRLRCSA
jgi:hypothetical protein